MNKIKGIVKQPGVDPVPMELENTLEAFQGVVGGSIETVTICSDLVLVVNEDGRLNDMRYNATVCGLQLFGPIVWVGRNEDEFCDVPVGLKEIGYLLEGGRIR